MTLQRRADEGQDKHGYRSEPRPCELCGQLVVSVCDSLDMGAAATCHYEPATEDEKAKRIAELEAENAALRQDAEIGRAIREFIEQPTGDWNEVMLRIELIKGGKSLDWHAEIDNQVIIGITGNTDGSKVHLTAHGETLHAALAEAGLVEK